MIIGWATLKYQGIYPQHASSLVGWVLQLTSDTLECRGFLVQHAQYVLCGLTVILHQSKLQMPDKLVERNTAILKAQYGHGPWVYVYYTYVRAHAQVVDCRDAENCHDLNSVKEDSGVKVEGKT